MATGRGRLRTLAARPGQCSETVNAGIKSLYLTPPIKTKPNVCIESMPSEMLLKIFSYLDAVSLLSVGCVNKRFYELANDNYGIVLHVTPPAFGKGQLETHVDWEPTFTSHVMSSLSFSKEGAEGIDVTLVPPNKGDSDGPPPPHFQLDLCEKLEAYSGIWLKLYSSSLQPKWTIWKMKSKQTETVSSGCAALHDKKPGYWKKEYIFKQTSAFKTRVMRLVKLLDPYTGLPCKNKEAMKVSGLSWIIVLKDKNGKEHVIEKPNLSFKDTSVTILWYGTHWPSLDVLSTLKLFGVTPLLPYQSSPPNKNGPRRFSLIAEYHLANLTESSVAVGADELVQLFSLSPGLLVGIWKEKNEIAFVMASLHYNQLLERSILGSATVQYAPPPNKPLLDDIDPEYGLHDYSLHLDLHGRSCMYLCGSFKGLFCRKGDIENGYLRLSVVSLKDNRKHFPIIGTLGICWETDAFKGNVKDCFVMDLTLLDESGKPFWCFSAPVYMELSSKTSGLYDYMGPIYTADYVDSEGKVCVEFVWLEETKEYITVSLVLYVSTKKVNSWYGTNY